MATTTNYSWETPDDTDLVKDGAAAIRTLGSSIDTTTKALNPSTTLGDIEYRSSTANTNTRLGIGSTGNVLTVAGGVPTWAAPAGGGKILQVVSATTTTQTTIATDVLTDTTITATITPTSASSKIMVLITGVTDTSRSAQNNGYILRLVRGATTVETWDWYAYYNMIGVTSISVFGHSFAVDYIDSPASTSSLTYKLQGATIFTANSGQTKFQPNSVKSTIILMEVGA